MRNKLFVIVIVLPIVLGCGLADRVQKAVSDETATNSSVANSSANKTLTEKAVDTAVGDQKIGIPECDEAIEILAAQADNPDDNFIIKAGKKTALNMFRDQVKQNLEKNGADRTEVTKFCKEFRDNLKDSAPEANSNTWK